GSRMRQSAPSHPMTRTRRVGSAMRTHPSGVAGRPRPFPRCRVGGSPPRLLAWPPIEGAGGSRPEWPPMPGARSAIDCLLTPRSVAIVGASPKSHVGRVVIENLQSLGFEGPIYPVNPRYDEVMGLACYPSIDDVPETPEAVAAAVRIDLVPRVLRSAGARGVRAAIVPGGGFSETGEAARVAQAEIARVGREFGMAIAGPNCMGVIAPGRGAGLYIGTIPEHLLPG